MNSLKADVTITDGNMDLMMKSLDEKKVVLAAIELGEFAKKAIKDKYSDHFQAQTKLEGSTDKGVCFCQKPATHLVYFWR